MESAHCVQEWMYGVRLYLRFLMYIDEQSTSAPALLGEFGA